MRPSSSPRGLSGLVCLLLLAWATAAEVWAGPDLPALVATRQRLAAADFRLACGWLATPYGIPERVPQELLLRGWTYDEVMLALGLMSQGASLNAVLEARADRGWGEVAAAVSIDPATLSPPVRALLSTASAGPGPRAGGPPPRFVPDVRPGLSRRLHLPSFSPTLPDPAAIDRFRLSPRDVAHIRRVLARPDRLEPEWLRAPAGRDLTAADWLIAATLSRLKPFNLELLLEARVGEVVAWTDVASMFSVDPRIFTEGPLAAVYAIQTGLPAGAVIPSPLQTFPATLPLGYDLERLSAPTRRALRSHMACTYGLSSQEEELLASRPAPLELAEEGIAAALSRRAGRPLLEVLEAREAYGGWAGALQHLRLDLTGLEPVQAALSAREAR